MKLEGAALNQTAIGELQQDILNSQAEVLSAATERMVKTIQAEKSIFLFGTGHSHIQAEEGHFRQLPEQPISWEGSHHRNGARRRTQR